MTLRRKTLEKKMVLIRQESKRCARRVARRLLGTRTFAVLRPAKYYKKHMLQGWKIVKKCCSRTEANQYVRSHRWRYWLIEEIFD